MKKIVCIIGIIILLAQGTNIQFLLPIVNAQNDTILTVQTTADLSIKKTGIADSNGDNIFDTGDSTSIALPGQKIRYNINYDNIGKTTAQNSTIEEKVPTNTCFVVGSLQNLGSGVKIEYSNDGGSTYNYIATGNIGSVDCNVTNFRINFGDIKAGINEVYDNFSGQKNKVWKYSDYISVAPGLVDLSNIMRGNIESYYTDISSDGKKVSAYGYTGGLETIYYWDGENNINLLDNIYKQGDRLLVLYTYNFFEKNLNYGSFLIYSGENSRLYYSSGNEVKLVGEFQTVDLYNFCQDGLWTYYGLNNPCISKNGKLIYNQSYDSGFSDIMIFDGRNNINLSQLAGIQSGYVGWSDINYENGNIVWSQLDSQVDFYGTPYTGNSNVFYYDGNDIKNIGIFSGQAFVKVLDDKNIYIFNNMDKNGNLKNIYHYDGSLNDISSKYGYGIPNPFNFFNFGNVANNGNMILGYFDGSGNIKNIYFYDKNNIIPLGGFEGSGVNRVEISKLLGKDFNKLLYTVENSGIKTGWYFDGQNSMSLNDIAGNNNNYKFNTEYELHKTYAYMSNNISNENKFLFLESSGGNNNELYYFDGSKAIKLNDFIPSYTGRFDYFNISEDGNYVYFLTQEKDELGNNIYKSYIYNNDSLILLNDLLGFDYNKELFVEFSENGYPITILQNSYPYNFYYYGGGGLSGDYTTVLNSSGDIIFWDKLLVKEDFGSGENILYDIYGVDNEGKCKLENNILSGKNSYSGYIDISSISSQNKSICIKANFSSTGQKLYSLGASWITPTKGNFSWDAIISSNASSNINNTASISTSTKEDKLENNISNHSFQLTNPISSSTSSDSISSVSSSGSSSSSSIPNNIISGGGGGGWLSSSSSSSNINTSSSSSNSSSSQNSIQNIISKKNTKNSLVEAYNWAKGIGITNQPSYETYGVYEGVLRKDLAKIITIFAQKILDKNIVAKSECKFEDIYEENIDYQNYIINACNLGLMGYKPDGVTVNKEFWPNKTVTRAQFGTSLSRLLWGEKYAMENNKADIYYMKHLQALKESGIIRQINNVDKIELRGWIILMLYRYASSL